MKIRFDARQQYQLDAIAAMVDVFDGQPLASGDFELQGAASAGQQLTELGLGNRLELPEDRILENVRAVQTRNGLDSVDELSGLNFSTEMETGTGKTYVYLRTLFELRQRYGFTKFIIVVPSVAIREGVQKTIQMTADHFRDLYGNEPLNTWVFDSSHVSRLRQLAGGNQLQLLIINIDAFNKRDINVIHRESDRLSGRRPIEFIQSCLPIVIMDEPQNMESDRAREAIQSLNPMCTLRYSATHRDLYNLVYRLDPVRAYDLGLVKRIEVASVLDEPDFNQPHIRVVSIKAARNRITAKLELDVDPVDASRGSRRTTLSVSQGGVDLAELTGGREQYAGYLVDEINATPGGEYVSFSNGLVLRPGQSHGSQTDDVMRVQIRETVKEHLDKEVAMKRTLPADDGLKVLTLFFIDKVANYNEQDGKIRRWFVDAYRELSEKPQYQSLGLPRVEEIHSGYFAVTPKGVPKDSSSGRAKADEDAYALIMRDKERLLSRDEPLRFIFSHSALREGWDNPNVFQICTLNETRSELKKRQEIGRGMRLPVLESGERCFDSNVNRLTVIANEAYEDFARTLQHEIEEECGVQFDQGRIKNRRERRQARLKKGWNLDSDFLELWERIKHRTRYSVAFGSEELIKQSVKALRALPRVRRPTIHTRRAAIEMGAEGVTPEARGVRQEQPDREIDSIPDVLGYLQRETELTRDTLARIVIESGRLSEIFVNPSAFMDQAAGAIQGALESLIVDGIKYERIDGAHFEMVLFEEREIEGYLSRMMAVDKSIYDMIEYDSDNERAFAENLEQREDVKLFIKLPGWFKVDTPVGAYNPDWAIVRQEEDDAPKLYLVRETKTSLDRASLRGSEWSKVQCGREHFQALDVDFEHIRDISEL